jgi:hypothetical protein
MGKRAIACALVALAAGVCLAAEFDYSDFDDDLMRSMDDAIKDLEPVISAGNAQVAAEDANLLLDGLRWTESYFAAKGGAGDAVKFAQEGQGLTSEVLRLLSVKDLSGAAAQARVLSKSCRSCHDVYKPPKP